MEKVLYNGQVQTISNKICPKLIKNYAPHNRLDTKYTWTGIRRTDGQICSNQFKK